MVPRRSGAPCGIYGIRRRVVDGRLSLLRLDPCLTSDQQHAMQTSATPRWMLPVVAMRHARCSSRHRAKVRTAWSDRERAEAEAAVRAGAQWCTVTGGCERQAEPCCGEWEGVFSVACWQEKREVLGSVSKRQATKEKKWETVLPAAIHSSLIHTHSQHHQPHQAWRPHQQTHRYVIQRRTHATTPQQHHSLHAFQVARSG